MTPEREQEIRDLLCRWPENTIGKDLLAALDQARAEKDEAVAALARLAGCFRPSPL